MLSRYEKIYLSIMLFVGLIPIAIFTINYHNNQKLSVILFLKEQYIPLNGIKVYLTDKSNVIDSAITNHKGKAIFDKIEKGNYYWKFSYKDISYKEILSVEGSSEVIDTFQLPSTKLIASLADTSKPLPIKNDSSSGNLGIISRRHSNSQHLSIIKALNNYANVTFKAKNKNYKFGLFIDDNFVCNLNNWPNNKHGNTYSKIIYLSLGSHFYTTDGDEKRHYFYVNRGQRNSILIDNRSLPSGPPRW